MCVFPTLLLALAALPASSVAQTRMVPPGMVGAAVLGLHPVTLGDEYSSMHVRDLRSSCLSLGQLLHLPSGRPRGCEAHLDLAGQGHSCLPQAPQSTLNDFIPISQHQDHRSKCLPKKAVWSRAGWGQSPGWAGSVPTVHCLFWDRGQEAPISKPHTKWRGGMRTG